MASNNNTNSYGSYDASFSYSGGYSAGTSSNAAPNSPVLRRRTAEPQRFDNNGHRPPPSSPRKGVVKKLDFMFPKVDTEYTVHTDRGGIVSLIAYGLILLLVVAEIIAFVNQNYSHNTVEHIAVDTSLGKRMRVNLNITFPAVSCEDLHIDIMDVAGDSQLDIEDTMSKRRLSRKGSPLGSSEIVETNKHQQLESEKQDILKVKVPDDYCGPCYGAGEEEDQCCNTCDDLIEAYKKKRWRTDLVTQTSEQCIREGRDKIEPKKLRRGEGCNLQGYFMVNRVGGNFHMAMGEGIERDGRHIHTFNPDDTHNFNASHIIHHLSFGPDVEDQRFNAELTPLNDVSKIVTKEHGTTGLFQYFIKVVPTTYMGQGKGGRDVETNRFFFTERFRPLMLDYFDDDEYLSEALEEDGENRVAAEAGSAGGHAHHDHHDIKKNGLLPGVFFMYEIYPFEVEVSRSSVPFTHLLIRLMATVGGVFTIVRWLDSYFYALDRRNR